MIERSNFNTQGERPIPSTCPPEYRRRITEGREKRNAAPAPIAEPANDQDPEAWDLLKKFSAAVEQE